MPIYKRCSICGSRIREGTECQKCGGMLKVKRREYDRYARDRKAKAYYNSMEWLAVRQITMNIDKMDVWIYMTEGRIVEPDTVHHIEPLEDNWSRRKDIDNLMSLTGETHSRIENLYKTEGKEVMEKKLFTMLRQFREVAATGV